MNETKLARVNLNLLLPFSLLFEERHAGRVAERLHLSPSAVSHALRRLRALFNDPLFLPTPHGMVPTVRAQEMAPLVRELIERAAALAASAIPFDPETSRRRFRLGAPDTVAAALAPALVDRLSAIAPGIDLAMVAVLPAPDVAGPEEAWRPATDLLDVGKLDIAIVPWRLATPRLAARELGQEEFVVAFRRGHHFGRTPSLEAFADASHVLVSATGDPFGFVDQSLTELGLQRRVALTVPHFFMALDVIGRSDLIGAVPGRFANRYAAAFGLETAALPVPQPPSAVYALTLKAALADGGVAWLLQQVDAAWTLSNREPTGMGVSATTGSV